MPNGALPSAKIRAIADSLDRPSAMYSSINDIEGLSQCSVDILEASMLCSCVFQISTTTGVGLPPELADGMCV